MTAEPLPAGFGLALDPSTRATEGGRVLIGGSPLRILRLTDAGRGLVARWSAGERVGGGEAGRRLARRLVDAGMAHPRPPAGATPFTRRNVAVVIPIHGAPDALAATLEAVLAAHPGAVVVVDDGSPPAAASAIAAVVRVASAAVRLVRAADNEGPAAARARGIDVTDEPVLAFVDADVVPQPGWLEPLLAHLADPAVGAVAPRVLARPPSSLPAPVAAYERARSSLDRGPVEAPVRPGSRVSYVPTAALVVRRAAYEAVGGFDRKLRFGEDVDLVWRLSAAGWSVRYEPGAWAAHPARPDLRAWLAQRFAYGRSAAPLAVRHGAAVAPLTVSGWSVAGWGLVGAGAPMAGAGLMAATTAALVPKLRDLDRPVGEALRLAGLGHLFAGRQVASALRRAWFPLLVAMLLARRTRPAAVAAVLLPPLLDRRDAAATAPGPAAWLALALADDVAYGTGLWSGVIAHRRSPGAWRALVPARTGPFPPSAAVDVV